MTYTQIYEKYWDLYDYGETSAAIQFIDSLPYEAKKAWEILRMLDGRKGFEYWWVGNAGGMNSDCNDEIFDEMKEIVRLPN